MSRQWGAVSALRSRAATAAGWDTSWPVAYAQQPFTVPNARQWIEEAIAGGPGVPAAITAPNLVTYRYNGTWTLTLIAPPDVGARAVLDMGDLIQSTLLTMPAPLLPGNMPLLFDDVELGQPIPNEGDVRRQLIVRYCFYANATPGLVTVDPQYAVIAFGQALPLTGHAYDAEGNLLAPAPFAWASSNPAIASVDPVTGIVTGLSSGNCIITATQNGLIGSCNIAVVSLLIIP